MSSIDSAVPQTRLAATFRLLMKVRILLAGASLLLVPREQKNLGAAALVLCIGLLSLLAVVSWDQILPRLLAHPSLLAIDAFVASAAMEFGGVLGPFFLFTVVTSTVAGLLHRWPGMLLVCELQMLLYYAAAAKSTGPNYDSVIAMPVFYLIAGFIGTGLRRLFDEFTALDEARHQAEVAATASEERNRLAREMHDSLAKTLRGIAMLAAALPTMVERSPERAKTESWRIASAAEIASREARELITDLREASPQQPLGSALAAVVHAAGVPASLLVDPAVQLPLMSRYELTAIVKEALENVARHAAATRTEVRLTHEGPSAVLTVSDDGRGIVVGAGTIGEDELDMLARNGHYGLIGMRERAARVGGSLSAGARYGGGTTITVRIPMAEPPNNDQMDAELRRLLEEK